ncbi:hypothetical protein [Geodermatophilus sp. SYSU D01176]
MSAEQDDDPRVLEVDLLAWADWNRRPAATATRDEVVKYVVYALRARGLYCGDKPEPGLKALLGGLSRLPWVEREFGAAVADLARSSSANVTQSVAESRETLDGLLRLAVRWAYPLLVLNARARKQAYDRMLGIMREWPPEDRAGTFWRQYLKDNFARGGSAQSDVTKALLTSCGTREEAAALLAAADLESPARVALAHRLEFLRRKAVPIALGDKGGDPILDLVRELEMVLGGDGPAVTTSVAHAPPGQAVASPSWTGPAAGEYLDLVRKGPDVLRGQGVDDVAADDIVNAAVDKLMAAAVDGTVLTGAWRRLLDDCRRDHFRGPRRPGMDPTVIEGIPDDHQSPATVRQTERNEARSERLARRLHAALGARADSTPAWLLVKKLVGEPEVLKSVLVEADEVPHVGIDVVDRRRTQQHKRVRMWVGAQPEVGRGDDVDGLARDVGRLLRDLYVSVRDDGACRREPEGGNAPSAEGGNAPGEWERDE